MDLESVWLHTLSSTLLYARTRGACQTTDLPTAAHEMCSYCSILSNHFTLRPSCTHTQWTCHHSTMHTGKEGVERASPLCVSAAIYSLARAELNTWEADHDSRKNKQIWSQRCSPVSLGILVLSMIRCASVMTTANFKQEERYILIRVS